MKYGLAFIGAATLTMGAAPALAQDTDFTGPWAAGVVGYDINGVDSVAVGGVEPEVNRSVRGVTYGAAVGYDYDMGDLVVGGEAEFTDSSADADYRRGAGDFGLISASVGRDLYIGGRVGYKVAPTTLAYAKAGYTNARYNFTGIDGAADYRANLDADGYRIGAGVEQRVGTNAFGRVEYRYSGYSSGLMDFTARATPEGSVFDIDADRHQIMGSVGWRF